MAYRKLAKGGTLVVCGPLTVGGSDTVFPATSGEILITSLYNGTDYSDKGACLNISGRLYLSSDTEIRDIIIYAAPASMFFCCGNNAVFGKGISVSLNSNGSYPYIFGGTYGGKSGATSANNSFYDYTVQVDSGTWQTVRGGNYRSGSEQPMGFVGNVRVIINGGSFESVASGSDLAVVSATSFCGLDGDASLEINGGTINCAIYGVGRPGTYTGTLRPGLRGNVSVKITKGSLNGSAIAALQETDGRKLEGDFTLEITGGYVSAAVRELSGKGVSGECRIVTNSESLQKKATYCAKTVFVSDKGNDSNSGLSKDKPIKTYTKLLELIKDANGAVIVLCGDLTVDYKSIDAAPFGDPVPEDALKVAEGDILITSVNGARLKLAKQLNVNSDTYIDNVTLSSVYDTGAHIVTYDASLTVGKSVSTEGKVIIYGSKNEEPRTVTVYSGDFYSISGGYGAAGAVVMHGGSTINLIGGGGMDEPSGASVIMLGGKADKIIGADRACSGSIGVAVYGGEVGSIVASRGALAGDFGLIIEGDKMPEVNADNVGGKKQFSSAKHTAPAGFEDVGAVVYVSDGGTGDGFSALNPASSITTPLLNSINDEARHVYMVILDSWTVKGNPKGNSYPVNLTIDGNVLNVDFATAFGSTLRLGATLGLECETEIDNINVLSIAENVYIAANNHGLTIGENVSCDKLFAKGIKTYPSLAGGTTYSSAVPPTLTVNGGTWQYVYGGNVRPSASTAISRIEGDVNLVINGGEFLGGVYGNGMNNLTGNVNVEINGGLFRCGVFGASKASPTVGSVANVRGDITVDINGGEFRGDIMAAENAGELKLDGKFTLNINK
ncbi:MAG: hypothetical protein IIX69_04515, partial [Clostridia bacterium]|nr:hypothetical protein [Clostridia bacterium]